MGELAKLGGKVLDPESPASLVTADLTPEQVARAASLNTVQWIDYAQKTNKEVDNARSIGGADFLGMLQQLGAIPGPG